MKTVLVKCPYCGLKTEINVEELRDISSLVTRSKNVLNGDAITVSAGAIVCTLA